MSRLRPKLEQELINFIKSERKGGKSVAAIRQALVEAQWPEEAIQVAMQALDHKPTEKTPESEQEIRVMGQVLVIGEDGKSEIKAEVVTGFAKIKGTEVAPIKTIAHDNVIPKAPDRQPSAWWQFLRFDLETRVRALQVGSRIGLSALLVFHAVRLVVSAIWGEAH